MSKHTKQQIELKRKTNQESIYLVEAFRKLKELPFKEKQKYLMEGQTYVVDDTYSINFHYHENVFYIWKKTNDPQYKFESLCKVIHKYQVYHSKNAKVILNATDWVHI